MCVGDCACRAPPSACMLMFWFSRGVSGWEVGVFPPANDSAQVRVRMDKTQRLSAVQTEGWWWWWGDSLGTRWFDSITIQSWWLDYKTITEAFWIDASWFDLSVTQYSAALVHFTSTINSEEAKVLPNASFNPFGAGWISRSAMFLSCFLMCPL